ncbi:MAG: hypothetical protein ACYDA8_03430 [Deferrisomatales bacterium]
MSRIHRTLVEVALPLDAIGHALAWEKSSRHGNPIPLHPSPGFRFGSGEGAQ